MSKKPNILIINDDGIHAPGLRALFEETKELGNLTVVAPNQERSGAGMSISFYQPLHVKTHNWGKQVYSVSGTPTDCVKIALTSLCKERPDLILSGINPGSNAGRNLFYSGTIGGVFEAALNGIPGAALSCLLASEGSEPNYQEVAHFIPKLIEALLYQKFPEGTILNVNFPVGKAKGLKMGRQGKSYWRENPIQREHPGGNPYYWLGGTNATFEEEGDSDIALLKAGYSVAVPINLAHLTCHHSFSHHKDRFEEIFK